jgi:hypothetical protein
MFSNSNYNFYNDWNHLNLFHLATNLSYLEWSKFQKETFISSTSSLSPYCRYLNKGEKKKDTPLLCLSFVYVPSTGLLNGDLHPNSNFSIDVW